MEGAPGAGIGKEDVGAKGVITLTCVFRFPRWVPSRVLVVAFFVAVACPRATAATKTESWRSHRRRANERTGRLAPTFGELIKAHRGGDRNALGRVADRMGPARLAEAISGADGKVAEAALAAVDLTRGGISLLGRVAAQVAAADPARAAAAARALGSLLDGATPARIEDWDVPPDLVALACGGLRTLAGKADAAPAARLAALDAILAAAPICGPGGDLAPLVHDAAPAIRRAAVLVAAVGQRRGAVLREAIADSDRGVSAAAVAADCRVEGRVGAGGKETPPDAQSIARARALATATTTPPEDAVEMLDCLAAAGTPADRALLDELRRGPPSALRDRAVELGDLGARGQAE
jgi:hypothetical protein